ncbi:MAG: DUF3795 domain-containing protein [Erysipelotrichaceae bacterium]|nr:DUF3795 domain-containing protein [Erysipelotrichaceae bacterium]
MKEREFLAYCGLDCEKCDARIATINDDDELRRKTAELWSQLNHAEITPEMINCTGCRMEGVKFPFCQSMCPIRQCCQLKELANCGHCPQMDSCEKLNMITGDVPEAAARLKEDAGR